MVSDNLPTPDRDPFAPPVEPCECYCLHCRRTFMSNRIWFQRIINAPAGHLDGFWMCPTNNCGGAGFTFDIFPIDPNHPANEGWHSFDDEDEESEDDALLDESSFADDEDAPYDPDEPQWQDMDDPDEDDEEGEEWKRAGKPERSADPSPPAWRLDQERRFDQPDERPRVIDYTTLPAPPPPLADDDVPF